MLHSGCPSRKTSKWKACLTFRTPFIHSIPIIFDQLNWELILKAAMCNQGAPGLSGMDAYAWRRICSSFKSASHDLCHAMAAVARRICCSPIHPDDMSAFVTCYLIPLDKRPGICPIGIGETPTRIIAKAVLMLLQHDILDSAGPLQVCVLARRVDVKLLCMQCGTFLRIH